MNVEIQKQHATKMEFEKVLDDWHLLRNATVKNRKSYGSLVQEMYMPKNSDVDPHSPLWYHQQALKNKWSGLVYDENPMNGAALLGLGSVKGITYVCYFSNSRHKESWERVARIFNINLQTLDEPLAPKQSIQIRRFLVK